MELTLNGMEFVLKSGGNTILEYRKDKTMVYVGYGEESVDMYRGNFKIEDYVVERRPLRVTGAAEEHGNVILDLDGEITMKVCMDGDLAEIFFEQKNPAINRFWLRVNAGADEKCYGCGEQMSYFNLRGRHFPLWTSEPGVGRDKTTYVTWRSDVENKAGGDY